MSAPDRVELIRLSTTLTGLDFVQVSQNQLEVAVILHHLTLPPTLATALATITPDQVEIRAVGATSPERVTVTQHGLPIATIGGRRALRFTVAQPGGFGFYRLRIDHPAVDTYFNDLLFSFKAECPSELDCKQGEHICPPDARVDFPVDYRARDFWSFRRALLDFAAQRYPDWQDRLESDLGMVLVELLSALGDNLSYANDRIAREHTLEDASQRRSLRHLAALVDYPLDNGSGASAWIDVEANAPGLLNAGTPVTDARNQLVFELGRGLSDTGVQFAVSNARNGFSPYLWDEDATCLAAGSVRLTLSGNHAVSFLPDAAIDPAGKWVLLKTVPTDPARPDRRSAVRVVRATDTVDPLNGSPITEIEWDEPTAFELDLETLVVRGNLVPATCGETRPVIYFRIGPAPLGAPVQQRAIERVGPNHDLTDVPDATADEDDLDLFAVDRRVKYLFPLAESERTALVWLPSRDGGMRPEVELVQQPGIPWDWMPALIGAEVASVTRRAYTLEDGIYRTVFAVERSGDRFELPDYASSAGHTLRFGDGEFGVAPPDGAIFELRYRLGNGRLGNVAPDSLTRFVSEFALLPTKPAFVDSITNPLTGEGGRDPESAESIRRNAPQVFRALPLRAVRPEDYAEIAERRPWVQKAGATPRWTGSWTTMFVTPDPREEVGLSPAHRNDLEESMDRVRQAGRHVEVLDPRYADIDLEIMVCVAPDAYPGEVKGRVLRALFGETLTASETAGVEALADPTLETLAGPAGTKERRGFFHPDHFTFGTPLSRTALMAAIQAVPGVRAVEGMRVRRRGSFDWRPFTEFALRVSANELVRVTNDRLLPERGAVRLILEGGA
jgi:hypothetical protein